MDTILLHALYILMAYLIGSVSFSYLVGKVFKRIDIREHGSGNPGTTNAFRVLGKKLGTLVFVLDVIKGGVMITLVLHVLPGNVIHPLVYGLVSAVGHVYPVFLRFKGGKAVATGVGAFLFYAPVLGMVGLGGYILVLKLTRYVSLGSVFGTAALMVVSWIIFVIGPEATVPMNWPQMLLGVGGDLVMPIVATLGLAMITYRHLGNFKKIREGTEPKANFLQKRTKHIKS